MYVGPGCRETTGCSGSRHGLGTVGDALMWLNVVDTAAQYCDTALLLPPMNSPLLCLPVSAASQALAPALPCPARHSSLIANRTPFDQCPPVPVSVRRTHRIRGCGTLVLFARGSPRPIPISIPLLLIDNPQESHRLALTSLPSEGAAEPVTSRRQEWKGSRSFRQEHPGAVSRPNSLPCAQGIRTTPAILHPAIRKSIQSTCIFLES